MPSLRGQLLIASPSLVDPNFARTVVLVGEHSDEGAMGVVLNRPTHVQVVDAIPPLAVVAPPAEVVHVGGPVQPEAIIVLGEFADPARAGVLVVDSVGFLPASLEDTDDLGSLRRLRVFAGYAGWAAGQLEMEIEENAWIVTPALPDDAFTVEPDALWSQALQRMGGAYAVLARMPPDPSLN